MTDLYAVWRAGFTSRWHSGDYAAELAHTQDYICGHSGRMAILAMRLWGSDVSRNLLAAIALHDVGEHGPGDVSYTAKRKWPNLARVSAACEVEHVKSLGLPNVPLSEVDQARLDFLDRLDSWYYVRLRAPHVLSDSAWCDLEIWLFEEAERLKVEI